MKIEDGRITMRTPDDFHAHLREGRLLQDLLPCTAKVFKRVLVMPNLADQGPVLCGREADGYLAKICGAADSHGLGDDFIPLLTIQITEQTTPEMILEAREDYLVTAGKVYPRGMTTNSENGVLDYEKIYPALEAMQSCGMVACFHGESPSPRVNPRDREYKFLEILLQISKRFKGLKIVLEHITDSSSVRWVKELPNVAATITVHHLMITETDWCGGRLKPHLFCKPSAKRFEDRDALVEAALSGNRKFFLGTDSAPHPRYLKECAEGCAGIFTAPVAMPLLAQFFDEHNALDKLEAFCSEHGARWYELPLNEGTITFERCDWQVLKSYGPVVPFMAGETLKWQVVE